MKRKVNRKKGAGFLLAASVIAVLAAGKAPQAYADSSSGPGVAAETSALFEEIAGRQFWFGSGAGGWHTSMYVTADGSFTCEYSDSEMGDFADSYPGGTLYYANVTGQFTTPEMINSYTYRVQLESIIYETEPGIETIEDGIRYVSAECYGLGDTEDFYFYTPDAPVSELPEEYRSWVDYSELDENGTLPYYGFYNVGRGLGFSSTDPDAVSPSHGELVNRVSIDGLISDSIDNDYYGGYCYTDRTEDGYVVVINCGYEGDFLTSDETWEEYAARWAQTVCGYEIKNFTIESNEGYSARFTYPVYMLTWVTGENEDTRNWEAMLIGTDGYDYMLAYGTWADCPDADQLAAIRSEAFSTVTLYYPE